MESNKCEHCGKDFVNKYTKKRHLVHHHGEKPTKRPAKSKLDVPVESLLRCRLCNNVFTTISNRRRHEITAHGTDIPHEQPIVPTAIICQECDGDDVLNFTSLGKYRDHLEQHHGIPTRKVDYEFASTEEFKAWKDRLESDLGVNYSQMRGVRKSSNGTRAIYYCRRSGLQRERVHASEAKRPKKGSCKLGLYCTSSMEVKRTDNDVVHVSLYTDHRGHDVDLSSLVHTPLTKSERERIAGAVTSSISVSGIIFQDDEQDKILVQVAEGSGGNRLFLLEKKDLQNIAAEFGPTKDHVRHPDDKAIVQLIMNEMDTLVENFAKQLEDKIMTDLLPKLRSTKDLQLLKTVQSNILKTIAIMDSSKDISASSNPLPVGVSAATEPVIRNDIRQDRPDLTVKEEK
ncbi:uncharacterized protein [Palaemon carinicauda]|uniref:uncharacterized protein n=1 Tax=Palaemon carinicauda TaxID=392227 RepID=UPI0035B623F4